MDKDGKAKNQDNREQGPSSFENEGRDEFDWLVSYTYFRTLFREWLEENNFLPRANLSALVLGCGSSGLSQALVDDNICNNVLSIDLSESCIEFLSEKNKEDPRLRWAVADLNDPAQMEAAVNGQRFDLIVDKATLDAVVCDVDCAGYLHAVARHLRCGGAYVLVSLYHRALLQPLLDPTSFSELAQATGRCFRFECQHFDGSDTAEGTVSAANKELKQNNRIERSFLTLLDTDGQQPDCTAQCVCSFSPDLEKIRAHFNSTLDWYLTQKAPLLCTGREAELRAAFGAASGKGIGLDEAYKLMFTSEERQVYTFDDFCSDGAITMGPFNAEKAIAFIQQNQ